MDLSMVLWFVPALSAGLIIFAFLSAMFWALVWNGRGAFIWFVALCLGVAGITDGAYRVPGTWRSISVRDDACGRSHGIFILPCENCT